ncbi:MAG: 3'-5' exoribonuclease YhaM family protein [Thermodesulfobacteriota bacterium]
MKKTFIDGIREKDKVEDIFLVTKKEMGRSKAGKGYLNLKLMDRTGTVEGRVWDDVDSLSGRFAKDDFVRIRGYAVSYQSTIQMNIGDIKRVDATDIDIADFLPAAARNPDEMFAELEGIIEGMEDRHLRSLLKHIFEDEDVKRRFRTAPAAKSMHHTYIGGLLEHVLSLCGLADRVAGHYRDINRDLVITGAILHDIGKIYELSYERSFDYTDEGRLVGHITIGIGMIERAIEKMPDFPKELSMLIKHMLLSHHGYLEFGSPKRPKTVEAVILYYCDDLDSKIQSMQAYIEKERDTDSNWTSYHRLYERYIYKGAGTGVPSVPQEREGEGEAPPAGSEGELNLFKKVP